MVGVFARALHETVTRLSERAAYGLEGFNGRSKTGPVPGKKLGRNLAVMLAESFCGAQRNQQIKRSVAANQVQQFGAKVLDIGDDERGGPSGGAEDGLSHLQQLRGGRGNGLSAAGVG